jgi:signal transduction histidine kinase/CheY-like chemotaxis protein
MSSIIKQLEHTIRVLQDENSQLAERAEDSLLLGIIADKIENINDEVTLFEHLLEQISILKSIPFCSCGILRNNVYKEIACYYSFSDDDSTTFDLDLTDENLEQLQYGPYASDNIEELHINFTSLTFDFTNFALIPFRQRHTDDLLFIFLDDSDSRDRLFSIILLLNHALDIAVSKFENLHLLQELQRSNEELESRVAQRTRELIHANESLHREIAEKEASKKALQVSHESFLTILNSLDATVYATDFKNHTILFMNKYMIDSFGGDFTGSKCFSVFRGRSAPCDTCSNSKLLDENSEPTGVHRWEDKNPITGRWYINHDRAVKWTDGRLVRIQIATDITQMKEMETQLLRAQKMEAIGTLAGGIAHDFNNLLMGIQGRASLLQFNNSISTEQLEHLKAIEDYVSSAAELSRQMLGLAKGGKYEGSPVDITGIIENSLQMFARTHKELTISSSFTSSLPIVHADKNQLEQVLLNLFINAWQAMPDGGLLTVTTENVVLSDSFCNPLQISTGEYVAISVTDEGTGIRPENLSKVFDPFFTTKQKGRGTGLGLASTYAIIRNHGGAITVDSLEEKGTTFIIYLPIIDEQPQIELEKTESSFGGTEKILLIDDEDLILDVGKPMLEKLGYQVCVAKGGKQAIEKLDGESYDLIIVDLIMPQVDGRLVFSHIRNKGMNTPVLISSGYSESEEVSSLLALGAKGFIQKPFGLSSLSEKIRMIFDTPTK